MKFRKILKYLLFLALIISLSGLYSFSLKRNQQKKVSKIVIAFKTGKKNSFLTYSMIDKLLKQNNKTIKNLPKSMIDLYALENKILQNPYVEKASVFLTIDGKLKSIIKQRTPIARIVANNSYYIDKQGVKIPLSSNYSARVLLVSGIKSNKEIKEIIPLISVILADNFLQKEIIGIHRFHNGEYRFSLRSGNYKVDFGKLTNVVVKFSKLKAFYNKTFLDKTIKNYKTINVKYHNQVVCTK